MKGKALWAALVLVSLAAAARAQVRAAGEFSVNTTLGAFYPSIARDQRSGDFIVVWANAVGLNGQRVEREVSPIGTEFAVAPRGVYPAAAMSPRGDFVVAWNDLRGPLWDVMLRRFTAAGTPLGDELRVNTVTTQSQFWPNVAMDGQGNFVVAWTAYNGDGSNTAVRAQRFDALGNRRGSEFVANAITTGLQELGGISSDPAGNFVVAWTNVPGTDGSGYSAEAQRFDANGVRQGAQFRVNSFTPSNQWRPWVAHAPDGSFVVAFLSVGQFDAMGDVVAKRYSATGAALGVEIRLNTTIPGEQNVPTLAIDAQGNFVAAWQDPQADLNGSSVRARRFTADGLSRGADFQVNTYTTGNQRLNFRTTVVGSDEVGNFIIMWDGPIGALGQRYGGLHPKALQVDTAGNQVLEPGETVDVRPAWFNGAGSNQTMSGTLTRLTGPAGPVYSILDGTGQYPLMVPSSAPFCTNCYTISVSNPLSRPAPHWDLTAVEALTPDVQGQQKGWKLHVGASFADVSAASPFYRFIETLLHHGVTGGCGGGNYCPGNPTTRDQMAVFVVGAREGAGYAPPACAPPNIFSDVPETSPYCRYIEELFRRGVVTGCASGEYCPGAAVTREQMAIFVLRTLDPAFQPPACTPPNLFDDVPETSPFCRYVEELARRGVVTGCGGASYCPTGAVTREQMGVFISGTFGLTLYGP